MSFSLPVVSTEAFGIKEEVDNNETGFFFNAGDHFDLSKKLIILMDPEVRQEFGKNGYLKLKSTYTLEKMAYKYEKMLISLLSKENLAPYPEIRL
jgi:glycosyltransferase involved in cell wall biosynthesis